MSLPDAVIDAMVNAGCTAEQLAAAIKAANAEGDERRERKRVNNVERQRRYRERHAVEDNARNALPSVTERDSVTEPSLSPSPLPSPHTPPPTPRPHTHPETQTRARKGGDFPRPDWADPQHWSDFLTNRKRKRLPNTPTAYQGFLASIDRHATDDWPPGRLLEYATGKGWGSINEPAEAKGIGSANRKQPERESTSDIARRLASVAQAGCAQTFGTG